VILAFAIFLLAACSAAAGAYFTPTGVFSRRLVPFGGGVLMGVALFWLLPEMAEFLGWPVAATSIGGGALALWLLDRYVYPVCPACAPAHDHAHCETRLHGFALPLLAAAALHSALDGWTVMVGQSHPSLGPALLFGIAAHKVPEGLALGVIARASLASRFAALSWCITAQAATLLGAGLELAFAPYLGLRSLHALLALAGGSFLYLGGHAIHGELRRSGAGRAFVPALTGVAGSSVLRLFVR
jgi:zinc and cadmium transporter